MIMERKIGEIFEYNDEWYQCMKSPDGSCKHCDMNFGGKCPIPIKECVASARSDLSYVIFKKLEKVGEPYPNADKLYQLYKLPMNIEKLPPHTEGINLVRFDIVEIELKQNKEDMEENKTTFPKEDNALTRTVYAYVNGKISDKGLIRSIKEMSDVYPYNKNNLKPFSLELAKHGKPVCTRDGRKARIICFDAKCADRPIVTLVSRNDEEILLMYYRDGKLNDDKDSYADLMMLPEKKEGWVNVYRDCDGANITKDDNIYSSKEAAMASAQVIDRDNYVATTIIKWEEQS